MYNHPSTVAPDTGSVLKLVPSLICEVEVAVIGQRLSSPRLLLRQKTPSTRYFGSALPEDPTDRTSWNLIMRQGILGAWGVSPFGSAGHLASGAVSPHLFSSLVLSHSMYLVHATIWMPLKIAAAILVANAVAILFSNAFERHYRRVSDMLKAPFSLRIRSTGTYGDEA